VPVTRFEIKAYHLNVMRKREVIKRLNVNKYLNVIYIEIKPKIIRNCVLNIPTNFSKIYLWISESK